MSFAKKSLGQNFLVDGGAIAKIIAAIPNQIPLLLEIGPGRGALSADLARKAKKYCALEKDDIFAREIGETLRVQGIMNAHVFHADALEFEWERLWMESGSDKTTPLVVCANLPYNVATEIFFRLLNMQERIPLMVLMFQKEVAERIAARSRTKQYGNLSVAAQNFYSVENLLLLKPGAFRPSPKVDSAVLLFRHREKPILPFADAEKFTRFIRFVRICFSHRRKTLENSLALGLPRSEWPQLAGKKSLQDLLSALNLDGQRRPETLSIEEFGALYQKLVEAS